MLEGELPRDALRLRGSLNPHHDSPIFPLEWSRIDFEMFVNSNLSLTDS